MAIKNIQKCPLKKLINGGDWTLEKTLFDRQKINTAIGVDYHNYPTPLSHLIHGDHIYSVT